MKRKIAEKLLICGLGAVAQAGCGTDHLQPVDARLFIPQALADNGDRGPDRASDSSRDLSRAIAASDLQPSASTPFASSTAAPGIQPQKASVLPESPTPTTHPFDTIEPIGEIPLGSTTQPARMLSSDAAANDPVPAVPAPAEPAPPLLAGDNISPPLLSPAGHAGESGVYMTLGGVLAQVNDKPIYANQILTPLKKELTAKARELSPAEFRQFAAQEIVQQLKERISDEQYFATFFHALNQDDRNLAEAHAMMDRHDRVIAAGGSVEQARKKAADQGEDFDQQVEKDYRDLVFIIYRRRNVDPLIEVSPDEMREFYTRNLSKLYSSRDEAQFRVIEIDPAKYASEAAAKLRIKTVRDRAGKGEDFATLASTENDSAYLKDRGGYPLGAGDWIERGSYILEAVEAALWELQPGSITPVIETKGKLYIARLEARRDGSVKPFEDQSVQNDIFNKLRQAQMNRSMQQRKDESATQAMIKPPDASQFDIALEMAMQRYAQVQLDAAK